MKSNNPVGKKYRKVAEELGVRYLFGRWGISFYSQLPGERKLWHIKLIPLDGWITDPKEVAKEMEKRNYEL